MICHDLSWFVMIYDHLWSFLITYSCKCNPSPLIKLVGSKVPILDHQLGLFWQVQRCKLQRRSAKGTVPFHCPGHISFVTVEPVGFVKTWLYGYILSILPICGNLNLNRDILTNWNGVRSLYPLFTPSRIWSRHKLWAFRINGDQAHEVMGCSIYCTPTIPTSLKNRN